ncbi:Uncharacterised protein [Klebsiella pneumoniae]|nr:Uncharacterised protein [Klebsiella pneumoniae]
MATVIRRRALRDIRDIRLGSRQRRVLLTERDQVLPDLIVFRHHSAPGIQINASAIWFSQLGPIEQLIQTLGIIEQHSGRRAPQLRVKGHVFCSKRGFAQTRV